MFPMKHLQAYTVRRPQLTIDEARETQELNYQDATEHTITGFLHEIEDSITAVNGHIDEQERRAVFTCPAKTDIRRHDLIIDGQDVWLVDEQPNKEASPFTGWQPTVEARLVAWRK